MKVEINLIVLYCIVLYCIVLYLPNNTHSSIRLFADDCVLYGEIKNESDSQELQKDLNSLIGKLNLEPLNIRRTNRRLTIFHILVTVI